MVFDTELSCMILLLAEFFNIFMCALNILQAISVASCFSDEGPVLIVCPAVLRFSWAEELEHWLPTLLPKDIHLGTSKEHACMK